ncbi:bile acid:sodium symporter family protein [Albirhodobacter sp. R86504]|jgi:sodium/bile acid cotransporter 7|uniref:bile acid:sodium symporter family protein n=1 Tax=Albirhodobacter sp. R86504 TaxID=3093848 RepID=UPI0036722467
MKYLKTLGIDAYMILLLVTVAFGVVLPASGAPAEILGYVTYWAVSLLFFLYGTKLSPAAVRDGFMNLRLQGLVLGATFVLFPVIGLIFAGVFGSILGSALSLGLLFLAVLPSTVQSSIAFTSIAKGNVPAAICAASVSNLIGVFLTPALVALLLHQDGGAVRLDAVIKIGVQILLPFVLGQLLRGLIGPFIARHSIVTKAVDRGSILLIVYSAFSASTVAGLWNDISTASLASLIAITLLFLAVIMGAVSLFGRLFALPAADRLALFFCGSTKSLASGLPIAAAIFPADQIGAIVLPVMIYHMAQLLVSAYVAQRSA